MHVRTAENATALVRDGTTSLRVLFGLDSAQTAAGFELIDPARGVVVWAPGLTGIAAIARSAIAVIVRLGFTPGLAGMTAPSQISRFW